MLLINKHLVYRENIALPFLHIKPEEINSSSELLGIVENSLDSMFTVSLKHHGGLLLELGERQLKCFMDQEKKV